MIKAWNERELREIEIVISHLNVCLNVSTGLSLRFITEKRLLSCLMKGVKC